MNDSALVVILSATIIAGTPILFAALGEILCERAGILNLGVEGMMLVGAVAGFSTAVFTGSPWLGLLASMLAGGIMSIIHGFLSITLRSSQVVSGLALTIFGTGLSGFLGKKYIGVSLPTAFAKIGIPVLKDIPFLGPVLFVHDAMVYISFIIAPLIWYYLNRTRYGLNLKAVGENPSAADAAGINVFLIQYIHVFAGGAFAGMGGTYLSLAYAPSWLENMTAGRGWIAVALVIFAAWDPIKALIGSYIFGGLDILGFRLQVLGVMIPTFFLKMLPYIFTVLVLVISTSRRSKHVWSGPASLTKPYYREDR